MNLHNTPSITEYPGMSTECLRKGFMLGGLFAANAVSLTYTDVDRALVGTALPTEGKLKLEVGEELRADFFCQRREIGIINLAEAGTVTVDGTTFEVGTTDMVYVGRGSKEIAFEGTEAVFYFVSYPAHADYPTVKVAMAEAKHVPLGSSTDANERVIRQYIHEGGAKSCQLVMGFTELKPGSVWNTMPSHTHTRRSEVYMYFDVPANHAVLHLMGKPQETRNLWVHDREVVVSPPWSVHSGCGTNCYKFVWAMGGENQRFDDMDPAPIATLL